MHVVSIRLQKTPAKEIKYGNQPDACSWFDSLTTNVISLNKQHMTVRHELVEWLKWTFS